VRRTTVEITVLLLTYNVLNLITSDSVTRVTIYGDSDSTRVTLRKMVTQLKSRFSQNDSTRVTVVDSSQSHFCNIFEILMNKSSSFAHKEMNILYFSDDQDWRKFSVLPV